MYLGLLKLMESISLSFEMTLDQILMMQPLLVALPYFDFWYAWWLAPASMIFQPKHYFVQHNGDWSFLSISVCCWPCFEIVFPVGIVEMKSGMLIFRCAEPWLLVNWILAKNYPFLPKPICIWYILYLAWLFALLHLLLALSFYPCVSIAIHLV